MKESNNQEKSIRIFVLPIIIISLLTAIDQFTKYIILVSFQLYESKPVIKDVFSITYIQNKGMAWGMFQGKIPIFLILTAIILILCFRILYNVSTNKRYAPAKYVVILLISGAIGNLIDRVKLGYVVDFFNFELINFPVFNVADIYVVVSMIAAIILLMFVYNDKETDDILRLSFKKKLDENNSDDIELVSEEEYVEEDK